MKQAKRNNLFLYLLIALIIPTIIILASLAIVHVKNNHNFNNFSNYSPIIKSKTKRTWDNNPSDDSFHFDDPGFLGIPKILNKYNPKKDDFLSGAPLKMSQAKFNFNIPVGWTFKVTFFSGETTSTISNDINSIVAHKWNGKHNTFNLKHIIDYWYVEFYKPNGGSIAPIKAAGSFKDKCKEIAGDYNLYSKKTGWVEDYNDSYNPLWIEKGHGVSHAGYLLLMPEFFTHNSFIEIAGSTDNTHIKYINPNN